MEMQTGTETKIAVMSTKLENIEADIKEINTKLDRVFITKTELELTNQRVSSLEKTIAKLWGAVGTLALMIVGEVIRLAVAHFN